VGAKIKKKIREAFQPDKLPFRASGKFQFSFLSFDDGIGGFWFCVGGKILKKRFVKLFKQTSFHSALVESFSFHFYPSTM
jgi:hypothetical protein